MQYVSLYVGAAYFLFTKAGTEYKETTDDVLFTSNDTVLVYNSYLRIIKY